MVTMKTSFILLCCFISIAKCTKEIKRYEPTWKSLDSRPNPKWFDDSKIGLMMHWGVYSVPAFGNEWTSYNLNFRRNTMEGFRHFLEKSFKANITYPEFAPMFTAALFDPNSWAKLFKKSGVKYVVLTGKHCDGFTLWPSKTSFNWNSMDVGPKRDLYGELGKAVKKEGLRYGVYYSMYETFSSLLEKDWRNGYRTQYYAITKIRTELDELINTYKPDIIWSMDSHIVNEYYLKTKEFLAWLFNDSPVMDSIVVNDRWGSGTLCRHGGFSMFYGCRNSNGAMKHEAAVNLDRTSWGYNRLARSYHYMKIEHLLATITRVVSGGGNVIVNIGPTHDGRIPPIAEERLLQMGEWLEINGAAIYQTEPWKKQKDAKNPNVFYTKSKRSNTVFAIILKSPKNGILHLSPNKHITEKTKVSLLTKKGDVPLVWRQDTNSLEVKLVSTEQTKWFQVIKICSLGKKSSFEPRGDSSPPKNTKKQTKHKKTEDEQKINDVDMSIDLNQVVL